MTINQVEAFVLAPIVAVMIYAVVRIVPAWKAYQRHKNEIPPN